MYANSQSYNAFAFGRTQFQVISTLESYGSTLFQPQFSNNHFLFSNNHFPITIYLSLIYWLGDIPFIFLTARAERLDLRKGMEMGADDYLTKPFDDMELLNAIDVRLKKQAAQQSFYSKSLDQLDARLRCDLG